MTDDNGDPGPDGAACKCKLGLIEQMTVLGVDEFYIEVELDHGDEDGGVRVLSIYPKPKK